jgi:hypothetical protein
VKIGLKIKVVRIGSDALDWNEDSILFHKKIGFEIAETTIHFIKNI